MIAPKATHGGWMTAIAVFLVLLLAPIILAPIGAEANGPLPLRPCPAALLASKGLRRPPAYIFNVNDLPSPLDLSEWLTIDRVFRQSSFELQLKGDIAEHHMSVAMYVTNNPAPRIENQQAKSLLRILDSEKMRGFFSRALEGLTGEISRLYVRRLQGNSMSVGDVNHAHRDTDDDPDYKLAVLLYLSDPSDYEGGEVELEDVNMAVKPAKYTLLVFPANSVHSVNATRSKLGKTRDSIVLLLGDHDGPNRKFAD